MGYAVYLLTRRSNAMHCGYHHLRGYCRCLYHMLCTAGTNIIMCVCGSCLRSVLYAGAVMCVDADVAS